MFKHPTTTSLLRLTLADLMKLSVMSLRWSSASMIHSSGMAILGMHSGTHLITLPCVQIMASHSTSRSMYLAEPLWILQGSPSPTHLLLRLLTCSKPFVTSLPLRTFQVLAHGLAWLSKWPGYIASNLERHPSMTWCILPSNFYWDDALSTTFTASKQHILNRSWAVYLPCHRLE